MNRNLAQSLRVVFKYEGGYVNHPKDPGGPTNKGITLETFHRYIEPTGTIDDLKRLTDAQAAIVYKKQYWDKVQGDILPDGVDLAVFDLAVNSGPIRAVKFLQAACGVQQDGFIGPVTLDTLSRMSRDTVINSICDDRLAWLKRIKDDKGKPLWPTFGRGWSDRVKGVRGEALKMSAAQFPAAAVVEIPVAPAVPTPTVAPVDHAPVVASGGWFSRFFRRNT